MTKRKKGHPSIEEVLARPWCYYCERDFDDTAVLISHQKAKHFKCDRCNRRLNTIGGLGVHMNQVHKEALTAIENCLANRNELDREIFAMEGIPDDVKQQHDQRVLTAYYEAQAEHQRATGNPTTGTAGAVAQKKPKTEETSDLKKRLAEFKAKKAQQAQSPLIGSNGADTPTSAGQSMHGVENAGANPQNGAPYSAYPQPYGQRQSYPQAGSPFSQTTPFVPPPTGPPGVSVPQVYGVGSPSQMGYAFRPPQTGQYPGSVPPRPLSGLPPAPGLPQRPTAAAPVISHAELQQMHHGHNPNAVVEDDTTGGYGVSEDPRLVNRATAITRQNDGTSITASVSSSTPTIAPSTTGSQLTATTAMTTSDTAAVAAVPVKKVKKDEKATKLVYADNEVSPEEKMAQLTKYTFSPMRHASEKRAEAAA